MNTALQDAADLAPTPLNQPRWMTIVGWVLTILPTLMFVGGGAYAAIHPEMMAEGMKQNGWPEDAWPADVSKYIVVVEIICGLLYVFPKTSVLGAILLTGYLGGAVAVHARMHDPNACIPVIFGIIVWLGVYLREPRLRQIAFWR